MNNLLKTDEPGTVEIGYEKFCNFRTWVKMLKENGNIPVVFVALMEKCDINILEVNPKVGLSILCLLMRALKGMPIIADQMKALSIQIGGTRDPASMRETAILMLDYLMNDLADSAVSTSNRDIITNEWKPEACAWIQRGLKDKDLVTFLRYVELFYNISGGPISKCSLNKAVTN